MSHPATVSSVNESCGAMKFKQKLLIHLSRKFSGYMWFLADTLTGKLDGLAQLYDRSIEDAYTRDFSVVGLSPDDRVLHIGCGAYPLTDITLARVSGVKHVVGIDNDPKAVRSAQAVIAKKQLHNQVTIEHGDGRGYPVKPFDIIVVSSCAFPNVEILKHVITTAKKQGKIIVRELDVAIDPIVECIKAHTEVVLKQRIHHIVFPFIEPFGWQTFYLIKK